MSGPGLLPLAVLTESQNPTAQLREVALALDTVEDRSAKANLTTATAVFGGLLVKPKLIRTILRSDIMKESAINLRQLDDLLQLAATVENPEAFQTALTLYQQIL